MESDKTELVKSENLNLGFEQSEVLSRYNPTNEDYARGKLGYSKEGGRGGSQSDSLKGIISEIRKQKLAQKNQSQGYGGSTGPREPGDQKLNFSKKVTRSDFYQVVDPVREKELRVTESKKQEFDQEFGQKEVQYFDSMANSQHLDGHPGHDFGSNRKTGGVGTTAVYSDPAKSRPTKESKSLFGRNRSTSRKKKKKKGNSADKRIKMFYAVIGSDCELVLPEKFSTSELISKLAVECQSYRLPLGKRGKPQECKKNYFKEKIKFSIIFEFFLNLNVFS